MKKHRPIKNATMIPMRAVQKRAFEVIDQGTVDNDVWYVVQVEPKAASWIRQQDTNMWYNYKLGSYRVLDTFDIHEKLYSVMTLKWA